MFLLGRGLEMRFSRRCCLFVWTLVALLRNGETMFEKPATSVQECKKALSLPTLEVLPGGGWDNLRNLDMGRVIALGYSSCQTTEDGSYIIPDEVFVIPQKQSNLDFNSEIVENWQDFKSSTAFTINTDISLFSVVHAKFSTEFQRMKTHMVNDQSVATRVQVRNHLYTVKVNPNFAFDPGFKSQLMVIANHLENNQSRKANFLTEVLILNYGTHVLTKVDAGTILVQEDHIKSTFFKDSWSQKSSITASAGASFQDIVNFGVSMKTEFENDFTKQYMSNRTNSRIESIGGVPFYPGITLKVWQESITNQLVAIDRSGLPLHFFINSGILQDLPEPTVKKLARTVEEAAERYFSINTHPGCTDTVSPNFNFQANTDDGSCKGMASNYTFGGAYQTCNQYSGQEAQNMCQNLQQKNPLTGDFSCPQNHTPIKLSSQFREEGFHRLECHLNCFIFCWDECRDVFRISTVQFNTYWCAASGQVPENSGYLFGGLFSSKTTNPLTNGQSCPTSYYSLKLFDNLNICVSRDYEIGYQYSVPFGGFFSCVAGNPLAGPPSHNNSLLKSSLPLNNPSNSPKTCPSGFSQHLALVSDGCQVSYCVKSGLFTGGSLLPVRLPPFSHPPIMSLGATNTVLVMTEMDMAWIKDSKTQMWKLANLRDVRETMTIVTGKGRGLSGGETAGITISVTTVLAVLIALGLYGKRWYKKKGYRELESQRLVPDQSEASEEISISEPAN